MSSAFSFDVPPFDALSPAEQALVRGAADSVQFAAGAVLLGPLQPPTHLYLLTRGHVQQFEGGEAIAVYGSGDVCALRALLAERASGDLVALDEVQAWRLPRAVVQALIAGNLRFSAWLFADKARRLAAPDERKDQHQFLSLMMVRIRDAYMRKPFYVDGALDLVSLCRLLAHEGRTDALVRDGDRVGIFTTTDLRDALLQPVPPAQRAVRDVARFELITIDADAEVFEALLLMIRHRVHRVLVMDGERIDGVLSQLDLMGFVSNHSHLIALQIEQADSVAALKAAALQMDGLVELLHSGGIKVEVISRLMRELNSQLFGRLWALLAPPEVVAHSCLVVMGSEGRGEQILKTDQDNALLLRDGFEYDGLQALADRFIAALIEFGYPRCPGDIMLSNPLWRQPLAAFKATIHHWLYGADPQGAMHLAIFLDAAAVAGDAALLRQATDYLYQVMVHNEPFLARFAAAADQFSEPGGWWSRWTGWRGLLGHDDPVFDLKKLGTFPIVHGVRALALQHRITQLSTTGRLHALVERRHLGSETARDLTEALHFFMALKLKNNLRQRQLGQPASNLARLSDLGTLQGDQLKDALAIIKRFRQHLHQHFRLDAL